MASASILLQYPCHEQHPLELLDFSECPEHPNCRLCRCGIWADGYACMECVFYTHRECAEAPPTIHLHPLHADHTLTLLYFPRRFHCNFCGEDFSFGYPSYRCDECDFNLDNRCALSTLSELGGTQGKALEKIKLPIHMHALTSFPALHDFLRLSDCLICRTSVEGDMYICLHRKCGFLVHKRCVQDLFGDVHDINLDISCASSTLLDREGSEGKTPKWIALPLHQHLLTSFSARYDFVGNSSCVICKRGVERDGYACLHWECSFLIHKRCVPDLYYTDGTKAPQVYHRHPLEIFRGEDMGTRRCMNCGPDQSRDFIGCASCLEFFCRECVQVPEIIQYPHHPDHNLVLSIDFPESENSRYDPRSVSSRDALCYGCPCCDFFVDISRALKILAYSEEGMNAEITVSWHEHPLYLSDGTESSFHHCSYCEDEASGPMYACKDQDCCLQLHKRCSEMESTMNHPHHPDHQLTLCMGHMHNCGACSESTGYLRFSCKICAFFLHGKCAARVPTQKHSLHEHKLLHMDEAPSWECNRCGVNLYSPFFRCVPCNFNSRGVSGTPSSGIEQ